MSNKEQYLSIGKVAKILGVAVVTLRRWEKLGKLTAKFRTFDNHRRYFKSDIHKFLKINDKKVICYSRVSSHDQKKDLIRQDEKLRHYCKENNINNVESILDLGSGLNFNKIILNAKFESNQSLENKTFDLYFNTNIKEIVDLNFNIDLSSINEEISKKTEITKIQQAYINNISFNLKSITGIGKLKKYIAKDLGLTELEIEKPNKW